MAKSNTSKKTAKSSKSVKKVDKRPVVKIIKKTAAKKTAKSNTIKNAVASKKPLTKKNVSHKPTKTAIKLNKKAVQKTDFKKNVTKPVQPAKVTKLKATNNKGIIKNIPKEEGKAVKSESSAKKDKIILKSDTKIVKKQVKELLPTPEKIFLPTAKPSKSRGRKKKKKGDDDDDEFDGSEPLDPVLLEILSTSSKPSKKKVPKIIKTFVNPINSLPTEFDADSKLGKGKKEPKGKFEVEYVVRTSPGILYECLSTPSGLSEWFADDVNIRDGIFTFFWDGSEQKAKLLGYKDEKFIRFQWLDKLEGSFFEFKIEKDELTGDISLIITDFAEEATDKITSQLLWDSQVNKLLHVLGAL